MIKWHDSNNQHQVEDRATRPEWHQSPGLDLKATDLNIYISIVLAKHHLNHPHLLTGLPGHHIRAPVQ